MKKTYALRVLLTATMLLLTACGGGGADGEKNAEPEPVPEPVQRPYRAFVLNQEEKVQTTFIEMTEEHLYEFTVNHPSMINITLKLNSYGDYHELGLTSHLNNVRLGAGFTVFDENNNIITILKDTYNDIGTLQPGTYYLVVGYLLQTSDAKKDLIGIHRIDTNSGQQDYDLLVTHNIVSEDIHGTEEVDILRGDDSDQTIYGYSGKDKIYGEAGSDIIYGGEGDDLIHGGIGSDDLTGGEGQDIFLYTSVDESTFNLTGRDIIRDFSITEDFIDISSLPEWNENFKYRSSNYFNGSEPDVAGFATIWFVNGSLYGKKGYYTPGNSEYDFVIELEGVTSLPVERIIFP